MTNMTKVERSVSAYITVRDDILTRQESLDDDAAQLIAIEAAAKDLARQLQTAIGSAGEALIEPVTGWAVWANDFAFMITNDDHWALQEAKDQPNSQELLHDLRVAATLGAARAVSGAAES